MKYTYETDPAETQAMLSTLDSIFSRFIAAYTQTENRRLDMREREIQADREREARASLRTPNCTSFGDLVGILPRLSRMRRVAATTTAITSRSEP